MQFKISHLRERRAEALARPCLVVPICPNKAIDGALIEHGELMHLEAWAAAGVLTGKAGEHRMLAISRTTYCGLLALGVGEDSESDAESIRRAFGQAAATLAEYQVESVVIDATAMPGFAPEAAIEGIMLAQYRFDTYKKPPKDTPAPKLVSYVEAVLSDDAESSQVEARCHTAVVACEAANWARDLSNGPANAVTPAGLAEAAREMAQDVGCAFTCMEREEMEALGMEALLGVSRGSAEPPKLILLERRVPKDARTIALVGKGITFDTGGISIKPAQAMHEMKYDMCGAAAVLGAMRALCQLDVQCNLVCVVPSAENTLGPSAQKPGDIIKAYNGTTIEVNNTDAEGRLILADAMAYVADKHKPDAMVDLATLTGACIVALGHYAAGLLANDDELAEALEIAGDRTGERVWRLPLWKDYSKLMEGTHADLTNIGPPKEAGAITAAAFLEKFTGKLPWAHLDIAGTAWGAKNIPYWNADHATGYGVRLLTEWILAGSR